MNMKRILRVNYTPVSTYPHTANTAAFLWEDDEIFPWLMNYYIKIFGWDLSGMDYEDFWLLDCPAIQYERLDRNIAIKKWGDYISFIRDMLDEGYYVYLTVKTGEISAYKKMIVHMIQ